MPARLPILILLMLAGLAAAEGAPAATAPGPAAAAGKAALIVLDTEIDGRTARYLHRALRQAREAGVGTVVTQITSPGGEVGACLDIVEELLAYNRQAGDHPARLVAFVDGMAWSGGALTAYAHKQIYLTPGAHIGDIGIITIGADGKIEYLPEKIESPMRAQFRTLAEANGWDAAKLQKMTARNQELYRFDLADGKHFVIEDDLGKFLADHPEVKSEQKVLVLGKDRFISYTAAEAVADGMATGIAKDLDGLWATLGVDRAQVIDLRPTSVERVSWAISGYAAILASLAVLCVIMELKTPGLGLWAVLASVFGTAFFVCQYYQDLAGNVELVLVALGVLAMVAELFFLPTGGFLGFGGLAAACIGLVMAFMPDEVQFSFGSADFGNALLAAMRQSLLALIVVTAGIAMLIRALPRSRAMRRIAATAEISGTSAGALESSAATLVGRRVKALSDLRPIGQVEIDGDAVSASSEHGEFIAGGATVEIVAMRFGEAIVRPAASPAESPA
jgi:membrane-bound serine protease (ClpP class)